jgi:hypothetical protein
LTRALVLFLSSIAAFSAQLPRVEAGIAIGGIRETTLGEYPVAAGGRASVRVLPFLSAELEFNRFPVGGAMALFPATQGLFGVRAGYRLGPLGVYGKLRPGFVRFDHNLYATLGTCPALDAGGVLELYSSRHVASRFDLGDTVVFYGTGVSIPAIATPGPPVIPGTRHQVQWSFGLSVWF